MDRLIPAGASADKLLESVGRELYGRRWRARLAAALGVGRTTMWDWRAATRRTISAPASLASSPTRPGTPTGARSCASACATSCRRLAMRSTPVNNGAAWTPQEINMLFDLAQEIPALSIEEVAAKLGRGVEGVKRMASQRRLRSHMSAADERTWRPCICCARPFSSSHVGNRMCSSCVVAEPGPSIELVGGRRVR
jgi:hypothetical protein